MTELTGIADDVLAFWIKNGLLVPSSGGEGRGSHRKFDYVQVTIAAVLQQLRRFGSNIGTLKSFAELLQRGVRLDAIFELDDSYAYQAAISTANQLQNLREAGSIEVYDYEGERAAFQESGPRAASRKTDDLPMLRFENETDFIEHSLCHGFLRNEADAMQVPNPEEWKQAVLRTALALEPSDHLALRLFAMLVDEVRTGAPSDNLAWLVFFDSEGNWDVRTSVSQTDFGLYGRAGQGIESAIYISVSAINERLWGADLAVLHAEHQARIMRWREDWLIQLEQSGDPKQVAQAKRMRRAYDEKSGKDEAA